MNLLQTYADGIERTSDMERLLANQEMNDIYDANRISDIASMEADRSYCQVSRWNEDGELTSEEETI